MIAKIYPYKMGSKSAKELARLLGCRRVRGDSTTYHPRSSHVVINWGNSELPNWPNSTFSYLNHPRAVGVASNKNSAFHWLRSSGVEVPDFTPVAQVAYDWEDGVMVRQVLTGHSGNGCVYVPREAGERLLDTHDRAPLFVRYIKKSAEYRVHVGPVPYAGGGFWLQPFHVQQKRVRSESVNNNFQIRSHDNGWVFCSDNVDAAPRRDALAVAAVQALHLDFGAVDIIYNSRRNEYYVLEVNTAPGLEGTTLIKYAELFRSLL